MKVIYRNKEYTVEKIIEPCNLVPYTLYKLKEKKAFKNVPASKCKIMNDG